MTVFSKQLSFEKTETLGTIYKNFCTFQEMGRGKGKKRHPRKFSIEIPARNHLPTKPTLTKIKLQPVCCHTTQKLLGWFFLNTEGIWNSLTYSRGSLAHGKLALDDPGKFCRYLEWTPIAFACTASLLVEKLSLICKSSLFLSYYTTANDSSSIGYDSVATQITNSLTKIMGSGMGMWLKTGQTLIPEFCWNNRNNG